MSTSFVSVPVSELTVGTVLTEPVFDRQNPSVKLLGANITITEAFLKQMATRTDTVVVGKRDLAAIRAGTPQGSRRTVVDHQYPTSSMETEPSRELDSDIKTTVEDAEATPDESNSAVQLPEPNTDRYDPEARSSEVMQREQQVRNLEDVFDCLVNRDGADTEILTDVCRKSLQSIVYDKDLFLCLAINPYDADYPARHSLHSCAVATAIGVVLGLDSQSLANLGIGCLIHDVGMLLLYRPIHKLNRRLHASELVSLAEHPIRTFDALARVGVQLSPVSRIVAYQIHERCDGSGYPRGWPGYRIHPLAKIAAVADSYVAMVRNRPDRRGMLPYFAIKKILDSIPMGLHDAKAVRGLLNAISLYPIGSFVTTNDGRTARVVKATGETYTQPIIELWDEKHEQFEPDLFNLVDEPSIEIVSASLPPWEERQFQKA